MALTPGLEIPFGVQPVNPVPVDSWSGPYSGSIGNDTFAGALAAANASIPSAIRFQSMEVRIIVGGQAYKYWYRDGIADSDLIQFSGGGGGGGSFFESTIAGSAFTTGSIAFKGSESINSPNNKGTDVFFYVSGSSNDKSLFGGDLVVSGALNVKQGFSGSLTKLTDGTSYLIAGSGISIVTASNGAITIVNDGTVGDIIAVNAGTGLLGGGVSGSVTLSIDDSVIATLSGATFTGPVTFNEGLSGSLTSLSDGTSYLIAGNAISITSASNGAVTISSTAVTSPGGSTTQVQFNDNGVFGGDSGFTYSKDSNSLFVSGAVLINKSAPSYGELLSVNQILTSSSDFLRAGIYVKQTLTGSSQFPSGDPSFLNGSIVEIYNKSKLESGYGIIGAQSFAYHQSTSSIDTVWGYSGGASVVKPEDNNTAGNISSAVGVYSTFGFVEEANFTGSITNAYGFKFDNTGINASRTVTNAYGIKLENVGAAQGVTNAIGIDIEQINTASGTKLGIRTQDAVVVGASDVIGSEKLRINGTSRFDDVGKFISGLSGSLTQLTDGTSYLVAGNNIAITTGSNGAVTIQAIVAGYTKGFFYGSSQDGSGNIDVSSIGPLVNGYDEESDVDVYLNGQLLTAGTGNDYTVPTSTTIHFNNTLNFDDVVTVRLLTTGSASGGSNSGEKTFTGVVTFNSSSNIGTTTERLLTSNADSGITNFSISNTSIFYVNNPSGNITANFTGVPTTNDRIVTTKVILSQSVIARTISGVQVDGISSTIDWLNGMIPSGNSNKQDVFEFTLIRSGSAWKTLGQMNSFG